MNRAQFLVEEAQSSNRQNVNWSRATLCELIATRILRRFGEDHEGADGLLLLAHILVAGFEPFQSAPAHVRREAEAQTSSTYYRTLPALEVAILTESKHFLSSTTCQRVVSAIYEGRVIYTPSTFWDIIPDRYKLKPISIYDPRESPLLNQYRLIVPRTRNILEAIQFAILLALYIGVMLARQRDRVTLLEAAFAIYAFGWGLDQFATILAHGWYVRPAPTAPPSLPLPLPLTLPPGACTRRTCGPFSTSPLSSSTSSTCSSASTACASATPRPRSRPLTCWPSPPPSWSRAWPLTSGPRTSSSSPCAP